MNLIRKLSTFYNEMNPSTLSGAIDVVVIKQPNGDLVSSPFHVRFGKLHLLRPKQNRVDLYVNSVLINDLHMKVGEAGEAFFVVETENPVPADLATSPIQKPADPGDDESMEFFELNGDDEEATNDKEYFFETKDYLEQISETKSDSQPIPVKKALSDGTTSKSFEESEFRSNSFETVLKFQDGYHSDGEYKMDSHRKQTSEDNLSDTELESGQKWTWGWGGLPVKTEDKPEEKISVNKAGEVDIPLSYLPCILPNQQQLDEGKFASLNDFDIEMSLCGDQIPEILSRNESIEFDEIFEMKKISFEAFCESPVSIMSNPNLASRINGIVYKWSVAGPFILSLIVFNKPLTEKAFKSIISNVVLEKEKRKKGWNPFWPWRGDKNNQAVPPRSPTLPSTPTFTPTTPSVPNAPASTPVQIEAPEIKSNYVKTIRLTSDQLKSLNLKYGQNIIQFTVNNENKRSSCSAMVYLWNHDEKIVISDVDGTITRSDALGHVFTAVGKDWTHPGVANLFSRISQNGYKIVYLTARSIGQSHYTREFLKWVEQNGSKLPEGPCICSPDRLISALHREVIKKNPQEFKIAVLKDFATLFPSIPFYAGFGNRTTDAISYKAVGVPVQRIFTINPQGDIKAELVNSFKSSYYGLQSIVDQMFPPIVESSSQVTEEFTDFNYWKSTLPEVLLDIEDLDEPEEAVVTSGYPFYEIKEK